LLLSTRRNGFYSSLCRQQQFFVLIVSDSCDSVI
jgi:hypothetical protein